MQKATYLNPGTTELSAIRMHYDLVTLVLCTHVPYCILLRVFLSEVHVFT